jgi:large subunit ribosomal protein L15
LGPGSGTGKTAGRGHKGQRARSGARRGLRTGFTGGSMPLYRHVPKVGFSNPFRATYQVVNLEAIAARGLEGEIGPPELAKAGLIKRASQPVKVLAQGEVKGVLTIKAHAFSRAAVEKIERAGGKAEVL